MTQWPIDSLQQIRINPQYAQQCDINVTQTLVDALLYLYQENEELKLDIQLLFDIVNDVDHGND